MPFQDPDAPNPIAEFRGCVAGQQFGTVLADPPWQFQNRTGKIAPEHRRLSRYGTMTLEQICALPVAEAAAPRSHLNLWCPNAMLPEGLRVLAAWSYEYKSNLIWHRVRKNGGPDRRGVGFYFRNVTEMILFGIRGKDVRTLKRECREIGGLMPRWPLADVDRWRPGSRCPKLEPSVPL